MLSNGAKQIVRLGLNALTRRSAGAMSWVLEEGENSGNASLSRDEPEVVIGGSEIIERNPPSILIETLLTGDPAHDDQINGMLDNLRSLGYELWEIVTREQDLKSYLPDSRFIPCSYPKLLQNTLCVHASRRETILEAPTDFRAKESR